TTNPTYIDSKTGISYVRDEGFTDTGLIHNVDKENLQPDLAERYDNLRFFPSGERNCYTLRSLTPGGKYLLRAAFGYGDYDKLNSLPTFDLYFGANYWTTVTIVNSSTAYVFEIIALCPSDFLQICLVNIGSGTPFISGLDLRSLKENLYPQANDPYDRMWQRYQDVPSWTDVTNKSDEPVQNSPNNNYDAPSAVMRSASTPVNASRMDISWSADASMGVGVDTKYSLALYFAELEAVQGLRQFDVSVDNNQLVAAFSPTYLLANVIPAIVQGSGEHSISLLATSKSVLPPLINAMEIFMVWPLNESTTASLDANAMVAIQTKFKVKRNWVGDPCAPISFAWYGLDCSYTPDGPPRIIAINLSSSGLVGEIDASFGQLTLLQRFFFISYRDLSSNDLNGPIPMNLLEKSQDGFLTLRIDNNPNLCGSPPCNTFPNKKKKPKSILQIVVPVIGALLLVALLALVVWSRRKKRPVFMLPLDVPRSANQFENWSFKSKELKIITNNFNTCVFWSCVFWLFGEWNSCCSEDAVRDIFTRLCRIFSRGSAPNEGPSQELGVLNWFLQG
uniref:Malectin-like domain-containing protein n=1 Tax=Aegilops tauschii subsp. strangulata TaxID=200361 RepID=A0A453Q9B4_AEGTS